MEIEDSDVVSDRGQDAAARNPMDVTGYVVQFKQPSLEWSRAQEKEFERSKKDNLVFVCLFSSNLIFIVYSLPFPHSFCSHATSFSFLYIHLTTRVFQKLFLYYYSTQVIKRNADRVSFFFSPFL